MQRLCNKTDEELKRTFKQKVKRWKIETLCIVFNTNKGSFYGWLNRPFSKNRRELFIKAIIFMNNNKDKIKENEKITDVDEFIRKRGVTKCPTVWATGSITPTLFF